MREPKCPGCGGDRVVVVQRNYNASAFNGYRRRSSDYSAVQCRVCFRAWRTKAKWVDHAPNGVAL